VNLFVNKAYLSITIPRHLLAASQASTPQMPVDAVRFVPRYDDIDVTLLAFIYFIVCMLHGKCLFNMFMTPSLKKSSVEVLGIALGTVPLEPGVSDSVVNIPNMSI